MINNKSKTALKIKKQQASLPQFATTISINIGFNLKPALNQTL